MHKRQNHRNKELQLPLKKYYEYLIPSRHLLQKFMNARSQLPDRVRRLTRKHRICVLEYVRGCSIFSLRVVKIPTEVLFILNELAEAKIPCSSSPLALFNSF